MFRALTTLSLIEQFAVDTVFCETVREKEWQTDRHTDRYSDRETEEIEKSSKTDR